MEDIIVVVGGVVERIVTQLRDSLDGQRKKERVWGREVGRRQRNALDDGKNRQ